MASKVRTIAITTAAAVGVALGGYGVAAATTGSQTDPGPAAEVAETDGIDHEFEGEEIGENGNGIPDPDEAHETEEAEDGSQDADVDNIEHENEHEGDDDPDEGHED